MSDMTTSTQPYQPAGYNAETGQMEFETTEILHWDCGIWGEAGYAIPNDGGKPTSGNETIRTIVQFLGRELFIAMHKPDVKFSRPPNADWLYALNKALVLGIKRMGDQAVGWTDKREGDAKHATNTPSSFTVYPVPYFGERIRQPHAKKWCGWMLLLLSECMQHSDNDFHDNITDLLAADVQTGLRRIQKDMAMAYLGYTREQVDAPTFTVPDTDFGADKYKPEAWLTGSELVEERYPELWWPTTNDLTPISGVPMVSARVFGKKWPQSGSWGDGGAKEAAWPKGGNNVNLIEKPGERPNAADVLGTPGERPAT